VFVILILISAINDLSFFAVILFKLLFFYFICFSNILLNALIGVLISLFSVVMCLISNVRIHI